MSAVAIVWLVVALVSTAAVAAVLVGLVRHAFVLGRALQRFQREVAPLAEEIAALGDRASERSREMAAHPPSGTSRGRRR
jgi:hypothetical protein